ncbi:MAG: LysR family transcriptional regulator [Burkholderiales bacterium]|nr:LysR family transcriptional regulator [Burkholderiales bacterium]
MTGRQFDPEQTDWNLVRGFVAVVEHGSLTRGAESLGLSQPTLSRQIAELEKALGGALFERVARGLKLTAAGENLVEPARHMMAAARSLSMASVSQGEELSGTVRITASEIVSAFVLPDLLRQLAQQYPDIQIELVASNQLSNLLEREADIAIRMIRPVQNALIARHLADWSLGFYATRSYLEATGLPDPTMKESALSRYRWLGMDHSDKFIAGFRDAGMPVERSFFAFRCDNHLVHWQAMLSGLGIGIAMQWMAAQQPTLQRVFPQLSIPSLPVWLTTHRELKSSKRIRTVFDFLAQGLLAT